MEEKYRIYSKERFNVEVEISGSKSISNRALILSAFLGKNIIIENILFSDDTKYMIDGLRKLGNKIEILSENSVKIEGKRAPEYKNLDIYIGNAGTAMRFLLSYLASGYGNAILRGNKRMNERPIADLVEPLRELGVEIEYLEREGYPPLKIVSKGLKKDLTLKVRGDKSSQYISSLLMLQQFSDSNFKLELEGKIVSKPYIEMSKKMIEEFKNIEDRYIVEGDLSSASYFLAMSLITNSTVTIKNYFRNSIQGDSKFLNLLEKMGLQILEQGDRYITVKGIEEYNGIDINLNDMPDLAQTLASVAIFAKTPTVISDVENMRIKETDRITALRDQLSKIGVEFRERKDGFTIYPKKLEEYNGGILETYDDHRMAMSLSLLGLKIEGIEILNPKCVEKTFPKYFDEFEKIYR